MSKAPAIYCRGRADGVRSDEATYLSMTVRHGRGASGHWPFLPLPAFSSSASLLGHVVSFGSGSYLSFHAVASTVFSAYKGLTSVFGMGTGGSP